MARCEHERRRIVQGRELEDRRRSRAAVLERRDTAPGGRAQPALELRLDQSPGVQRERDARASRRAGGTFAKPPRKALDVAQQQKDRALRTLDLDVAPPRGRAREPGGDARVDRDVLELVEEHDQLLGVVLDSG